MSIAPLSGTRVLDLTNVLSGPFCCHQLAHFGAEVIKVEVPGRGDLARQLGADPSLSARNMGVSFLAQNAGKKSVTINLKSEQGKALFEQLLATADVLVENFRPGVMERLGLGYEYLRTIRGDLIYCAISGFGQSGSWRDRPAYDQIVQGASGVMSITGDPQSAPLRVGYPVADTVGGMTAAFAIAAALNDRPRGAYLDVSMLEAVLATMGWVVSNELVAGVTAQPLGNENMTSAPSGAFRTADGLLNIAANKQEQWEALAHHLDLDDLIADSRFATRDNRKDNRLELRAILESRLAMKSAQHWETELTVLGIPAGAVMTVPQVLAADPIASGTFIHTFDDVPGLDRSVRLVTGGVRIDGERPTVNSPPPRLGEHEREVFAALGLSKDDLESLRQEGAI